MRIDPTGGNSPDKSQISVLTERLRENGAITPVYMQPPTADRPAEMVAEELVGHFEAAGLTGLTTRASDFEPPAIAVTGTRPT